MKLSDLEQHWSEDSKIDKTELDNESVKIPYLHSKYWKFLVNEKILLRKKKNELQELRRKKYEYFSGKFSQQDYNETGWPPFHLKLLKQDIQMYIDSDSDICQLLIDITLQDEKCKFIEDIIKSLHSRGFVLKTAMDFIRFTNGG
jgi:hypothetical protein